MLSARAALSDLVHRYAALVDDRQFDSVAGLFTDSAELVVADPPSALTPVHTHRGRDAIAAAVGAVARLARTEHAIVGEVYDEGAEPDLARGRITGVAHHWSQRAADGGGTEIVDFVWHLRYDDEYRLTEAGWRISRRALTVNAIETRPVRRLRSHE
ncbi:hypothetical protein C0J29_15345 [Mycobacterium paragordonae]|jgi:hypothetical protein|uniref:SnoaL-like domain-containing protein n=1 Tax=Mycobacterium paragordonae TaxID=1389713 RepID=A0ABQ1C4D7_9MYCO|nr:nuclear transport factor 2 family protein [Mycobacterium paragordonae]AYE95973.1 hypothetical protein C0J29_15345 [Mycobacterium paragordonae]GFG79305.1 hypothetical protein MPRG_25810 [Mycobacterium paragordonae]